MKNETLFKYLNCHKSLIQNLALQLTNDFDTARYLYQETTHQAMKNKADLNKETFQDWIVKTMKKTYLKTL